MSGRGLVAARRPVLFLEPGRRVPHPAVPRQPRCGTGGGQRGGAGRHRRGDVADVGVAAARIRPALVVGAGPAAASGNPGRLHLAGIYHAGRRPYRCRVRDHVRVPRPRGPARVGRNSFTHSAVVSAVRHRRDEHCRVIMSMTPGSGQPANQLSHFPPCLRATRSQDVSPIRFYGSVCPLASCSRLRESCSARTSARRCCRITRTANSPATSKRTRRQGADLPVRPAATAAALSGARARSVRALIA